MRYLISVSAIKIASTALAVSLSFSGLAKADEFSDVYQDFKTAYKEQDFARSAALAEQAWQLGKDKFGQNSEEAIMLQHSYANMLFETGQYDSGLTEYRALAQAYEDKWNNETARLITALTSILDKTVSVPMDADVSMSALLQFNNQLTRSIITGIGDVEFSSEQEKAAAYFLASNTIIRATPFKLSASRLESFFNDAYQYSSAFWGQNDLNTVQTLFNSAMISEMRHRDEEAIERYQRIISIFDNLSAFSHPIELQAHAHLVKIYESEGQSDAATEHCRAIGRMAPWKEEQDPTPLYRVDPEYPVNYARQGRQGSATLSYIINQNGVVRDIQVVDDSHGKAFAVAAKKALQQWRFAPKFEQGKPITSARQTIQLDFKLGD